MADVLVDGASVGAVTSYTFTNVTANHTIAASFAIDTHTITATAGANGTISPTGAVTVNHGASQTFTITPATSYHVADVLVDGASVVNFMALAPTPRVCIRLYCLHHGVRVACAGHRVRPGRSRHDDHYTIRSSLNTES